MGLNLLTVGWTVDTNYRTDEQAVRKFIADLPVADIIENTDVLDPSGQFDTTDDDDELAEEFRGLLMTGFETATNPHTRMSNGWRLPETNLIFTIMGGGSWGDDPFDGYGALVMFIAAVEIWPELAGLTDIVCGGLPTATQISQYHINDERTDS